MQRIIAAIALLILAPAAAAQDAPDQGLGKDVRIHGGFVSGTEYLDMSGLQKKAYVSGLLEGMLLAPAFGATEANMQWFLSCTAAVDRLEMRQKINDYLFDNTDLWDNRNPAKMFRAVARACREWAEQQPQNRPR